MKYHLDEDNEELEAAVDENELVHRHIKKFQVSSFLPARSDKKHSGCEVRFSVFHCFVNTQANK